MIRVRTNHVPRDVINGWELSTKEREQFNYLDWSGDDPDPGSFFRYRGELHYLGNFTLSHIDGWDGIAPDSFSTATVVKLVDDDRVIVGYAVVTSGGDE